LIHSLLSTNTITQQASAAADAHWVILAALFMTLRHNDVCKIPSAFRFPVPGYRHGKCFNHLFLFTPLRLFRQRLRRFPAMLLFLPPSFPACDSVSNSKSFAQFASPVFAFDASSCVINSSLCLS
jgi:hypothetical protein